MTTSDRGVAEMPIKLFDFGPVVLDKSDPIPYLGNGVGKHLARMSVFAKDQPVRRLDLDERVFVVWFTKNEVADILPELLL